MSGSDSDSSLTTLVAFVRHFFRALGKNCRSKIGPSEILADSTRLRIQDRTRKPRVSSTFACLRSAVMSGWHSRCWTLPRMERLPDCGDACGPDGEDPDRQPPESAKPGR